MTRRLKYLDVTWSHELAYVIGLLTSDGNLSPDGRHMNITSQDRELTEYVRDILKLDNKIGRKARGGSLVKKYYFLQFGSKQFYSFLLSIGLTPAKSKTLGQLHVPDDFFGDFLRGCFDGDGNINESKHPESKETQLRLRITSASPTFLKWLLAEHKRLWHIKGGWIYTNKKDTCGMLSFAKKDSIAILHHIYLNRSTYYLRRKYAVAKKYMGE